MELSIDLMNDSPDPIQPSLTYHHDHESLPPVLRPSKQSLRRARNGDKDARLTFPADESESSRENLLKFHFGQSAYRTSLSLVHSSPSGFKKQIGNDEELEIELETSACDGPQAREYVDACLAVGVRVRMPVVQQLMLSPKLQALLCDHYLLNAQDGVAIATAVNSTPLCRLLSLSNNRTLQDEGVVCVCNVLVAGANTTLSTLQLAKVGGSVPTAHAVAWLIVNCSLRRIQLASNNIGDTGATALARALTPGAMPTGCCDSLQALDLTDNRIGSSGAAQICYMLQRNSTLEHLDVSWNAVRGSGAKVLIEGMARFCRLRLSNFPDAIRGRGSSTNST